MRNKTKQINKLARSSIFLSNKVLSLFRRKPHVICEALVSAQRQVVIAEKLIDQSEINSVEASIMILNRTIAALRHQENKE